MPENQVSIQVQNPYHSIEHCLDLLYFPHILRIFEGVILRILPGLLKSDLLNRVFSRSSCVTFATDLACSQLN